MDLEYSEMTNQGLLNEYCKIFVEASHEKLLLSAKYPKLEEKYLKINQEILRRMGADYEM